MTLIPILDSAVKQSWDYIALVQTSLTDVFTFRIGGVSGRVIGIITITYTAVDKLTISTVIRT